MKKILLVSSLLILLAVPALFSQDHVLRVLGTGSFTINSQPRELTLLQSQALTTPPDEMILLFGQEDAYLNMYGDIIGSDTTIYDAPYTWFKTINPMMGDMWRGWLPDLDGSGPTETVETIIDFRAVTVPAGTFDVYEVMIEDSKGNLLGYKMFAEGYGLIKWRFTFCNQTHQLNLKNYNVTGSGFWPLIIGNDWTYGTSHIIGAVIAPSTTATIDGMGDDWVGISPLIRDPQGDDDPAIDGIDIKNVYVAADNDNLYLMADFWDGIPDMAIPHADVCIYQYIFDIDINTGQLTGVCVLHDGVNWFLFGNSVDETGTHIVARDVLEISIPLANIPNQQNLRKFLLMSGNSRSFDITCFYDVLLPISTDVGDEARELLPLDFTLAQNYPNPFNPSTNIEYSLPVKSNVTITVLNLLGQEIISLVNRDQSAGYHTTVWSGRDSNGKEVASGIYFYKIETEQFVSKRKMMLLK